MSGLWNRDSVVTPSNIDEFLDTVTGEVLLELLVEALGNLSELLDATWNVYERDGSIDDAIQAASIAGAGTIHRIVCLRDEVLNP